VSPSLLAAAAASVPAGAPADFILGTTKPDATNTGLVSPTTTTDNTSALTIGAGSDITDTLFNGNVLVTGQRKFYNCRFRGKTTNTSQNIIRTDPSIPDGDFAEFERCQIDNRWFPTNGGNGGHGGIRGPKFKTTRCDISGAADGLGMLAPGFCYDYGSYIHGLWFTSPNSEHLTDGSHCDGAQGHGQPLDTIEFYGTNFDATLDDTLTNSQAGNDPVYSGTSLIEGNPWHTNVDPTFYLDRADAQGFEYVPWGTSAILFGYLTSSTLDNVWIHDGWVNGGSLAAINLDNRWVDSNTSNLKIERMRLGTTVRDSTGGRPYFIICKNTLTFASLTDNVYEDTGLPILAPNLRRSG
jgi:hypothetical protein